MKRAKEWYNQSGDMELIKDDRVIRHYRFNNISMQEERCLRYGTLR